MIDILMDCPMALITILVLEYSKNINSFLQHTGKWQSWYYPIVGSKQGQSKMFLLIVWILGVKKKDLFYPKQSVL